MIKKILFIALPFAALAVLSAPSASADYYDCDGEIRQGSPRPGECHFYTVPPREQEPNFSSTRMCDGVPCGETIYPGQTRPERPQYVPQPEPEEIPSMESERFCYGSDCGDDYDIMNSRRYCAREYCYYIYKICYSNGYCEEKAERTENDRYKRPNSNWRDYMNKYFYNNYYYNFKNNCGYNNRNCVYRGSHYGRFNNRYWNF